MVRDPHEWQPPHSAVSDLCGAMVMRDGDGDECGLPRMHPAHVFPDTHGSVIATGWLDPPRTEKCQHRDRPKASAHDEGRRWRCECGRTWRVEVVDYGHDTMPGEPRVEAVWREAGHV